MQPLYNYGISQEDVLSEFSALNITENDSLLCIASAGEIPLNMAALQNLNILAIDNSINQLRLCKIKMVAATSMESVRAASFLGYMEMPGAERQRIFSHEIGPGLPAEDRLFWEQNSGTIRSGVVNAARFEQYIRKVSAIGRMIIGSRNLYRLFECETVQEQKELFDQRITGPLLRGIFNIAFHPRIYKNRGIDPLGLTHSGARNIAGFFFQRFRNFCCSTIARKNYYLQYTFFNRVLFPEALPEFLQPNLHNAFVENSKRIEFRLSDFDAALIQAQRGQFNKIHLSNIGDWMSKESMAGLFSLVRDKTSPGARTVMRYIHLNHTLPTNVPELITDYRLGENLILTDRYPFYTIVPISRIIL
jgi:S-adenosylmethionine:diacylglycerol 3-amino-3-carboxypropyl transferase